MGHAIRAGIDLPERQRRDTIAGVVLEPNDVASANEREIEQVAELHGRRF
jgi:hypothetical protein